MNENGSPRQNKNEDGGLNDDLEEISLDNESTPKTSEFNRNRNRGIDLTPKEQRAAGILLDSYESPQLR